MDPRDEDFKAARFDTSFIDRKLGASGPLQAIDAVHEDLAAIAAAVHLFTKPVANGAAPRRGQPLARCRPDGSAAMIFEVAVGDARPHRRRRPEGRRCCTSMLDGRTHIVDARRINDAVVSMLVQLDGAARAVAIASTRRSPPSRRPATSTCISTAARSRCRSARPARSDVRKRTAPARHGTGPQRIVAPMPGKVVRVLVKPGDEVKARQGLVVVEAMKMENELRAARDGRVRDVAVTEGQSVDAGTVLLVVE